jgi:hypothetical protein
MRLLLVLLAITAVLVGCSKGGESASTTRGEGSAATGQAAAKVEACAEHGVGTTLCTRCNPALAAAFKAKGDWCPEHDRPESQCVLCNPELAQLGVK